MVGVTPSRSLHYTHVVVAVNYNNSENSVKKQASVLNNQKFSSSWSDYLYSSKRIWHVEQYTLDVIVFTVRQRQTIVLIWTAMRHVYSSQYRCMCLVMRLLFRGNWSNRNQNSHSSCLFIVRSLSHKWEQKGGTARSSRDIQGWTKGARKSLSRILEFFRQHSSWLKLMRALKIFLFYFYSENIDKNDYTLITWERIDW